MPDQPGSGLKVDLELKERHLLVSTDGENLGTYPLSQTLVERVTGDRFRLTIGNEVLEFAADDALGFSYEAMPAMSGAPTHRSSSWREFWRRNRPTATQGMIPTARPVAMEPAPEPGQLESDPLHESAPAGSSPAPPSRADESEAGVGFADVTLGYRVEGDPLDDDEPVQPESSAVLGAEGVSPAPGRDPVWTIDTKSAVGSIVGEVGEPESGVPVEPFADDEPIVVETVEAGVSLDAPAAMVSEPTDEPEFWSAPPDSLGEEECRGRRADGSPCGSVAINASGFCFAHDPDLAGERRLMTERVNQTAKRARATDPDLEGLVVRLERAVADVQDGSLDPQQALAMASLVQAMCDTIGVNRRRD